MKNKIRHGILIVLTLLSCEKKPSQRYVPESSGNINTISIVMPEVFWEEELGISLRNILGDIYEGLPIDEPSFTLKYIKPKLFNGFALQSRNIVEFVLDSIAGFSLYSDMHAKPQVLAQIRGIDSDEMNFLLQENKKLLYSVFNENEIKEKTRRISKALATDKIIEKKFEFTIKYPSAYKLVKDTTNFIWFQKPISKGHLNLIVYSINDKVMNSKNITKTIIKVRDSIGKIYIPGRLESSYMITEKAYRPFFYKTTMDTQKTFLTKGIWEVANDFMAGPFVNYMIKDKVANRWLVIEGFAFAPSISKRDYMFELETIIKSFSFTDKD